MAGPQKKYDYATDPDIAAFSVNKESANKNFIREPTLEEIKSKKKSTTINSQYQPDSETNYKTDPDIAAFGGPEVKLPKELDFVGNAIKKAFELKQGLGTGLGERVAGAIDAAYGAVVPPLYGAAVQAVKRPTTTPQQAEQIGEFAASEAQQPLGKLFGITQKPAYQTYLHPMGEVGPKIGEAINHMFNVLHLTPEQISENLKSKLGVTLPPEDIRNMGVSLSVAAPQAFKEIKPVVAQAGKTALRNVGAVLPEVTFEKVPPTTGKPTAFQSGGAAAAVPEDVLRGNIDSALANASPELQTHIQSKPPQAVNIPALETKTLEEKHGVNLSTGQRLNDTSRYSQEWNKRAESEVLGQHFNEQPAQISNAFEKAKENHAPDIPSTADASELGQLQINALTAKDAVRQEAISNAYKALRDANGGEFPIDTTKLDENIKVSLQKEMKTNHLSDITQKDLNDFYANPTFEQYEALRSNLADEMRSASNGRTRQAAYLVRQELEKLPIFGEEGGSPQAIQLKALADNARKLYAERQTIIASNPAYKAAIKEASSLQDLSSQGESLNAAKFHNKYVASATPEAIRRMKAEIPEGDIAHQAITFSELSRAKNAAVNASERNLTPEQFATFYKQNKSLLRESLPPEAMQDVTELGMLTSKIGQPKTGVFNYSNSFSSMLAEMAKEGLLSLGEAKLAAATYGASVPAVGITKQWMQKLNKEGFAREATNPYGGLTKE
jgi:hypothetical protein